MADPIVTAGRADSQPAQDPRKAAFRVIAQTLRKPDATEDETAEALEALAELSKE